MTIQQLEYVAAVDQYRHFVKAAEACGVTQSTLSAMISKLEAELDITIFDRNAHPVKPTDAGERFINQAKIVLFNVGQLKESVLSEREQTSGTVNMAVIPTVAPYILPKLFKQMHNEHPDLLLHTSEMRTDIIIDKLRKAEIDFAILTTPLKIDGFLEIPLYYEPFEAYLSDVSDFPERETISSTQLPAKGMWILQEGHCLRNQVFNFCHHRSDYSTLYEAGSIDTLIKIVDECGGYTVIPQMQTAYLNNDQRHRIRRFSEPCPVREISIVVRQDFIREGILNTVINEIKQIIPEEMLDKRLKKYAVKL